MGKKNRGPRQRGSKWPLEQEDSSGSLATFSWLRDDPDRWNDADYLEVLRDRKEVLLGIDLETNDEAGAEWQALVKEMNSAVQHAVHGAEPTPHSVPKSSSVNTLTTDSTPHRHGRSNMPDVGDRVTTETYGAGTVRFIGLHHVKGGPRIGVELDAAVGKNDGTIGGHRYFECRPGYGVLLVPDKVALQNVSPIRSNEFTETARSQKLTIRTFANPDDDAISADESDSDIYDPPPHPSAVATLNPDVNESTVLDRLSPISGTDQSECASLESDASKVLDQHSTNSADAGLSSVLDISDHSSSSPTRDITTDDCSAQRNTKDIHEVSQVERFMPHSSAMTNTASVESADSFVSSEVNSTTESEPIRRISDEIPGATTPPNAVGYDNCDLHDDEVNITTPVHKMSHRTDSVEWSSPQTPPTSSLIALQSVQRVTMNDVSGQINAPESAVSNLEQAPDGNDMHYADLWSSADVQSWLEVNDLERFEEAAEEMTGSVLLKLAKDVHTDAKAVDRAFTVTFELLSDRGRSKARTQWCDALDTLLPQKRKAPLTQAKQSNLSIALERSAPPSNPPRPPAVSGEDLLARYKSETSVRKEPEVEVPSGPNHANFARIGTPVFSGRYNVPRGRKSAKSDGQDLLEKYKQGRKGASMPHPTAAHPKFHAPELVSNDLLARYHKTPTQTYTSHSTYAPDTTSDSVKNFSQDVQVTVEIDENTNVTIPNRLFWDANREKSRDLPVWIGEQYGNTALGLFFGDGALTCMNRLDVFSKVMNLQLNCNELESFTSFPVMRSVEHVSVRHNFLGSIDQHLDALASKFPRLKSLNYFPQRLPGECVDTSSETFNVHPLTLMNTAHALPCLETLNDTPVASAVTGIWRLPKKAWACIAANLSGTDIVAFGSACKMSRAVAMSMRCNDPVVLTQKHTIESICAATKVWTNLKFTYKHHGHADFESLAKLSHLHELQLIGCSNIVSASSIGFKVSSVASRARFERCSLLSDANGLEDLDSVEFEDCTQLNRVCMLNHVRRVAIINCTSVSTNDVIYQLDLVPDLEVVGCTISAIGQLGGTVVSKSIVSNGTVREWKRSRLALGSCSKLRELRGIASVYALKLADCPLIVDVAPLRSVHTLELSNCVRIRDILPLAGCHTVILRSLPRLDCVRALASCDHVLLDNCDNISDISALKAVPRLEVISCDALKTVHCHHNGRVVLRSCPSLQSVEGASTVSFLELEDCNLFGNISTLNGALKLKLINMPNVDLDTLTGCREVFLTTSRNGINDCRISHHQPLTKVSPTVDSHNPTNKLDTKTSVKGLWGSTKVCPSSPDPTPDTPSIADAQSTGIETSDDEQVNSESVPSERPSQATTSWYHPLSWLTRTSNASLNASSAKVLEQEDSVQPTKGTVDTEDGALVSYAEGPEGPSSDGIEDEDTPSISTNNPRRDSSAWSAVEEELTVQDSVQEDVMEDETSTNLNSKISFVDPYEGMTDEERQQAMLEHEADRQQLENVAAFDAYISLGHSARIDKEFASATTFFYKALGVARNHKGEMSQEVANVYVNLGIVYGQQKDHSKEMEYFRMALPIFKSVLGESHVHVAMTLNNLGIANRNAGDYNRSMMYFNKALSVYCDVLGEEHPETIRTRRNIDRLVKIVRDHRRSGK